MYWLRAAAVPLLGSFFWALAAQAASSTLTAAQVDVDGDGRADTVTVSVDGRVAVRRSTGLTDALSFGSLPALSRAFIEVLPGLGGSRYLRVEGRPASGGRLLLLALFHGGHLDEVYSGPVGPVGRDAEYAVEVQLSGGELLRYQTSPSVRRCDGETRLFMERYVDPSGWQPAPEVTLPAAASGPALHASPVASADLEGPPLGIYRYAGASAQGAIRRADLLAPPRELDDGNRLSSWRVQRDARGAFVTAQADGTGHSVRALRIEAASPASQGALPRKLALIFENKNIVDVELQPGAAVQWIQLAEPVAARCLSVVVREGATAGTAIGELAIYSELDGTAGLPGLVERVAGSDSANAEGALRTLRAALARRGAARGDLKLMEAVAALLPSAKGDGRRRLIELLLDIATQTPPAEGQGSEQLAELLAQGIAQLPAASVSAQLPSLARAGSVGRKALERLAGSEALAKPLRADAMARLGEADPGVAVPALLRIAPSLIGTPFLARALGSGLATSLHCRASSDPGVAAVEQQLDALLKSASASEGALAATLIQALSQAMAGCADAAQRSARADFLAAAWPPGEAQGFLLRYRLLQGLERLGSGSASSIALLQKVLAEEREPVLRQVAAQALVALPPSAAIESPARLRGLGDPDAGVRLATLAALEGAMARQPEPALVAAIEERLTSDGWPTVRRVAAEVRAAGCAAGGLAVSAGLHKALGDADEQVQRSALVGVARCEGAGAVELLAPVAESSRSGAAARGLACSLLAKYGLGASAPATRARARKAATAALLDLLQDPAADERHAAALTQCLRGIGEAGDASDISALMDVAGSEVPSPLRQGALQSIGSICGRGPALSPALRKSLGALLKGAAADPDKQLQRTAQRVAATCK